MRNRNGTLTAYALSLGYIDRWERETDTGEVWHIDLSRNTGGTYDVNFYKPGTVRGFTRGIPNGWAQFDRLTDARKLVEYLRTVRDSANGIVRCYKHVMEWY